MNAPVEEYDIPNLLENNTWTLNTNDLTFGVHVVEITATVVSKKVGPTNSTTGQPIYNYLGCFSESTTGPRLFPNEPMSPSTSNDNSVCQTACYGAAKYAFAGTEVHLAILFLNLFPDNDDVLTFKLSTVMNVGAEIFLHLWQTRILQTRAATWLVLVMHLTVADKRDGSQYITTPPSIPQAPTQLCTDRKRR
jgi:hypothetical protein